MSPRLSCLLLCLSVASVVENLQEDKYDGCDEDFYYSPLSASQSDFKQWSVSDLAQLVTDTHRNIISDFAYAEDRTNNILDALADLWPGSQPDTVHLIYRNIDMIDNPNLVETWRKELFWPPQRGFNSESPAFTDAHGTAPGDWSVLDDKQSHNRQNLFYGECGTVQYADLCVEPANMEAAADTAQDSKIWTPPANVRGDIARALFYYAVRYPELSLVDCPPFAPGEFGYLSALLEWHADDPVDDVERTRNDRACRQWQGNRNPFVDYPGLVAEIYGPPDVIADGKLRYSQCEDATEAPTAAPNACSEMDPADVVTYAFNSVDPDQIIFYPIGFVFKEVGSLFITNKAWDGTKFLPGSGQTMEVSI